MTVLCDRMGGPGAVPASAAAGCVEGGGTGEESYWQLVSVSAAEAYSGPMLPAGHQHDHAAQGDAPGLRVRVELLEAEVALLRAQRDTAATERDSALLLLQAARSEKDALQRERDSACAARDDLIRWLHATLRKLRGQDPHQQQHQHQHQHPGHLGPGGLPADGHGDGDRGPWQRRPEEEQLASLHEEILVKGLELFRHRNGNTTGTPAVPGPGSSAHSLDDEGLPLALSMRKPKRGKRGSSSRGQTEEARLLQEPLSHFSGRQGNLGGLPNDAGGSGGLGGDAAGGTPAGMRTPKENPLQDFPIPFCSCTGVKRQVHKNGHWGWQSACCTNSVSQYPLPVHPNKSHGRIPGRRMTASTFLKLVEHLAANKPGFDPLQEPLDLAPYWQKHGAGPFSAQGSQPQGSPTGRSQREACSLDSLGWTTSDIYRS